MPTKTSPSFESSRLGQPPSENVKSIGKHFKGNPPSDPRDLQEWVELHSPPDSEIDFSDMPELTEQQLSEFVHGPWTPLEERKVALKLDQEVFDWLQTAGPEHAKKINFILKREAQRAKRRAQRAEPAFAKAS